MFQALKDKVEFLESGYEVLAEELKQEKQKTRKLEQKVEKLSKILGV